MPEYTRKLIEEVKERVQTYLERLRELCRVARLVENEEIVRICEKTEEKIQQRI